MNPIDVVKDTVMAIEAKDWQKVNGLIADDFIFAGPVEGQVGKKEFVDLHRNLLTAIPDWKFNLSTLKDTGGRVTGALQITGTHTAPLNLPMLGIKSYAPTHKAIRMPQEPINFTVRDNRLARVDVSAVPGGGVPGLLSQIGLMTPVDLIRSFYSAIESRDWKKIDNLVTDDLVFSGPVPQQYDKKEFINFHRALLAAFPDWMFNAANYKYDGTHVTNTVQITGTHTGTLDLPALDVHSEKATNKKFRLPQETLTYTLRDNRIYKMEVGVASGGGLEGILSQLGLRVMQKVGLPW